MDYSDGDSDPMVSILISVGIVALIIHDLWQNKANLRFVGKVYRHGGILTYLRAFGIAIVTLTIYGITYSIAPPFLRWGWANLVFGNSGNVIAQPFNSIEAVSSQSHFLLDPSTWLILAFWLLLILGIPFWARLEEQLFRRGANTWKQIAMRSTLFGLMHLIAGIPLLGGMVLIVPGFLFACRYKFAYERHLKKTGHRLLAQEVGVLASTADHAAYNALLFTFMTIVFLLT